LIVRIDGVSVRDRTINQSIERMRGPVDSKVRLTIYRKGQQEATDVLVIRDLIRVRTVFSRTIDEDIGYIRITKFNDLTAGGLQRALEDLASQIPATRVRGYILDLRNNPGGVFEQALSVASAFLTSGEIVTTRGRNPEDNRVFTAAATSKDLGKGRPLIVLITVMVDLPPPQKSSPVPCKIASAPPCSVPSRSERARCNPQRRSETEMR
jgi:carboxyl-terminal processing protease